MNTYPVGQGYPMNYPGSSSPSMSNPSYYPAYNSTYYSSMYPKAPYAPAYTGYRPIDGGATSGHVDNEYLRAAPAGYYKSPSGTTRPSARTVSNQLSAQTVDEPDAIWSTLFTFFSQFIDHDITLLATNPALPCFVRGERMPIPVPKGDAVFDPMSMGNAYLPFNRSDFCNYNYGNSYGHGGDSMRTYRNGITSFLDNSHIYGSFPEVTRKLRSNVGGRLKDNGHGFPPNAADIDLLEAMQACFPGQPCFAVGDGRGNENIVLLGLHAVFLREHNRLADALAAQHPTWNDETLFQEARKRTIAEWHAIIYNEYLPTVLGDTCPSIKKYRGWSPYVSGQITLEFAASAFRFGHSTVPNHIPLRAANGSLLDTLLVKDLFFNPFNITAPSGGASDSLGAVLLGAANEPMQKVDPHVVDALRNMLFSRLGTVPNMRLMGTDLASVNIQRGRDLGLPSYNEMREAFGLPRKRSFAEVSSDPEVVAALERTYTNINDADAWVVALAETSYQNSLLGELNSRIICEQFTRLRDADPWWFELPGQFDALELQQLQATRLGALIARNVPGFTFPKYSLFTPNRTFLGRCRCRDWLISSV